MVHLRSNLVAAVLAATTLQSALAAPRDFNADVAPILVKRCLECHNERAASGGLVLTTSQHALAGGDSGPVIAPGDTASSYLLERVRSGEMPPEKQGKSQQLPADEIRSLRAWIAAGANWPASRTLDVYEATSDVRGGRDWWSLQPVVRPQVPVVGAPNHVANPIDSFILAKLGEQELRPAPVADRRSLIRRAYFDVIGLPPTWEQIEAFVADESDDAWEKIVDELLASSHFGERWARYWLDLVRYAETCGYERDQEQPYSWRYRDWVVAAFNNDMPYDRFALEQLAGDELPDRSEQTVIATGFLRLGTWNDEPNDPHEYKYERLEDLVHCTSSAFLGLTVKCARCHDHKFDPILQEDYYRMAAMFWAGPIEPGDRALLGGPSSDKLGFADVLGWTDVTSQPKPLYLLKKGNPKHPAHEVVPGHLSTIPAISRPFDEPPPTAKTSHRRWQLANWITDPRNPLTARVFVNRLWQHHFGQGLVRTPNNFGFRGSHPTHPQLLDWLASELVAGDWKSKRLHKLILMSHTWRQSSIHPRYEEYSKRDYSNNLWWRSNRRRMDAEALRDAMLLVSGQLDLRLGGASFRPTISPAALEGLSRKAAAWSASPLTEQRRRSLYIFTQRSLLPPLMTTFDFSDTTLPCAQRDVTTVAPQALAMMNNQFVHQQSESLADRVIAACDDDAESQVTHAWRYALGRRPGAEEIQLALEHLRAQREHFADIQQENDQIERLPIASLCHVLLNSNEFLYVD